VDIKANGSDGPLFLKLTTNIKLDITLDAGGYPGAPVDLWVVLDTPFGFYSRVGAGWVPGIQPAHTGGLVSFSGTVMDLPPPLGKYAAYIVVDATPNGVLDPPYLFDGVEFHIF
jgi:hypothetical protein